MGQGTANSRFELSSLGRGLRSPSALVQAKSVDLNFVYFTKQMIYKI